MSTSHRVLAIDFGLKRLGLALSDDRGKLAAPYTVRQRRSLNHDIADLTHTIADLRVAAVVVGKPRGLAEGTQHHAAPLKKFVALLESSLREAGLSIAIEWWDERFSTAEAWRSLQESGISTRTGKDTVDAHAAAVILQGYLDAKNKACPDTDEYQAPNEDN